MVRVVLLGNSCACRIITIVLFWLFTTQTEARKESLRVIGGRDAYPGEFPYVARIQSTHQIVSNDNKLLYLYRESCSGTALSRTAVLTAAHCCKMLFNEIDPSSLLSNETFEKSYFVRYGSSEDGKPSASDITVDIVRCVVPPAARTARAEPIGTLIDDIALLKTQPAPLKTFARLSGVDYRTAFGQRVLIMGHGMTNDSDGRLNVTLELGKPLQVVDALWMQCETYVYPMVCAIEPCDRHIAICGGDSGGPAMHASGIIGISSYIMGNNCQMKTDEGRNKNVVYLVPVSNYLHWIYDEMLRIEEE